MAVAGACVRTHGATATQLSQPPPQSNLRELQLVKNYYRNVTVYRISGSASECCAFLLSSNALPPECAESGR